METASSDMKSFYRQRKTNRGGITKSSSKSTSKSKKKSPKDAAAIGSDITQPRALISHGAPDLQGFAFFLSALMYAFIIHSFLDGCIFKVFFFFEKFSLEIDNDLGFKEIKFPFL